MKRFARYIVMAAAIAGMTTTALPALSYASPASDAQNGIGQVGGNDPANQKSLPAYVNTIVNTVLFILGAVAVIMIVIGGFRYVTAGGDSSAITNAKNTILYAVIGLVVALMAYAIVNFVLKSVK